MFGREPKPLLHLSFHGFAHLEEDVANPFQIANYGEHALYLRRYHLIPHLGADQAALAHDEELSYTKDAAEAQALVDDGRVAAALILRGIPKAAIAEVAEAAETMPQKSTYFFPKLLTGVAFHSLVDA